MNPTTLAERIRTRRAELGLTVDDLADAAGVSAVAVRKWESGSTNNLKHEHLFTVSEALNVTPRWLALGDGHKEASPSREAYYVALRNRESAASDKVRRAWERISLVFAKAAMIALVALGALLHPADGNAGGFFSARTAVCVLCQIARRVFWAIILRNYSELRTAG